MKLHARFIILLLLVLACYSTYSQCDARLDGVYFRSNRFCSYNLEPYYLNYVQLNDSAYQITVDTIWNVYREYITPVNDNYFVKLKTYEDNMMARYLIDKRTSKEFLMDSGSYYYENRHLETDKVLFNYAGRSGRMFVFDENKVIEMNAPAYSVLGNDHDFIYAITYEKFRMGKEKFHRGTIIRMDTAGYQIYKEQPERKFYFNHVPLFLNSNYVVKDTFLYSEEVNCTTKYHYRFSVYYNDQIIDTNEIVGDFSFNPDIQWSRDTLYISVMNATWSYCNGMQINKISIYDSIILPEPWHTYRFVLARSDKYYIAAVKLPISDKNGIDSQNPALSINNVPIVESQMENTIFLLYDAKTYKYLGIPQIILADL